MTSKSKIDALHERDFLMSLIPKAKQIKSHLLTVYSNSNDPTPQVVRDQISIIEYLTENFNQLTKILTEE